MSDLGQERPAGLRVFDVLARSPWRWVLAVLLAVIAGVAIYQRFVIDPKLTATELEVWIAGDPDRVTIYVDPDAQVTAVVNATGDLAGFFVVGETAYVPAGELVADAGESWVEAPLSSFGPNADALTADRLLAALSRRVKECEPPSDDASVVLRAVLGQSAASGVTQICGSAFANTAEGPSDVIVSQRSVQPQDLPRLPFEAVTSADG